MIIAKLGTQPPEYKVALFLHCIGVDALKIFNGFQFDTPEDRNNLSKIIEKFDQYTIGELNETFERYNYNSRNQEENESIEAYVTALRTLAKTCNFCDCMRDSILCDRIVLGIRDKHTRQRLLQERKLDLKKCIDICRSTEATNSQLKTISAAQSEDVHGVKDKQQLPKRRFDRSKKNRKLEEKLGKTCKFCGQIHVFKRGKCPAREATCAKCKGRNHFASKCSSKVNSLREESDETEESDIEYITSITDRPEVVHAIKKDYLKEIYTEMVVAKKPVKFQVDSGASVNVIPAELEGVLCIADDILVCGKGQNDHEATSNHYENLEKLLQRCLDYGIVLNANKMKLRQKEVPYMGHLLSSDGLKPDPAKVEAVTKMPRPEDVEGVQRLNGFVNYFAKFLPKLSEILEPIRRLTRKDTQWHRSEEQDSAFQKIQHMVTQAPVLSYYDPCSELTIQCDASQGGLGAALLQNGRPIEYASRALTEAEKRYAQIEKEMLAIVFSRTI